MLTSCCFASVFADPHVEKRKIWYPLIIVTRHRDDSLKFLFFWMHALKVELICCYLIKLIIYYILMFLLVQISSLLSLPLSTSLYKYLQITIKSTTLKILWIAKRTRDHGIIIFYRNSKPKREFLKKIKNQKKKWCDEEFGLILHQFQP